uniref:Uncharacterized protein n=1 Tax=Zea mays TaxID=4577 RepID=A0A804PFI9_MAIZE
MAGPASHRAAPPISSLSLSLPPVARPIPCPGAAPRSPRFLPVEPLARPCSSPGNGEPPPVFPVWSRRPCLAAAGWPASSAEPPTPLRSSETAQANPFFLFHRPLLLQQVEEPTVEKKQPE